MKLQKNIEQFNQVVLIMGTHIEYIKLIIATEMETFCFDLPKILTIILNMKLTLPYNIINF